MFRIKVHQIKPKTSDTNQSETLPEYDNPFRPTDEDDQYNSDCIDEERKFEQDEDLWHMEQEF